MPQLGETVVEGTVIKWYKKVGDPVRLDEVLFDVETDKVTTEIPAPVDGLLEIILVGEGATVKVGARLAVVRESGEASEMLSAADPMPDAIAPQRDASQLQSVAARGAGSRLSPVVRKLIAEYGLDSKKIPGSGRDGRITREDVLAFVRQQASHLPDTSCNAPLNSIRRRTARAMAESWTTVPHVLQAVEVDFSEVEHTRRRHSEPPTYLAFVARAVVLALARYPHLNARFADDRLVLHSRINLGIAVDLNLDGLVVPVVKDAQDKSPAILARVIRDVCERARHNHLTPDDLTEATYTLSNSGVYGTLITAPIINPPQVAILSIDGVRKRPVAVEHADGDSIAIRPVGVLAQSFDHRAVDGAYSAAFLHEIKRIIETHEWAGDFDAKEQDG